MIILDETIIKKQFPERRPDAHKGDFGKVLIFAGSAGMAGAAVLAGRAAVKSGSGLVRFLVPSFQDPIYPILQISVPEATCVTPEKIGFYGNSGKQTMPLAEYDAIACGSGLGQDPARIHILEFIIENYSGKLVLDADALNAVAQERISADTLLHSPADIIITPHIGEAKRLIRSLETLQDKEKETSVNRTLRIRTEGERLNAVRLLAEAYQCTALLKGPGTLIASPKGDVFRNTTGNPGMAAGGSGDVLSGIIASFAGQGLSAEMAGACGAFIHGRSGDIAAKELGQTSLSAGDLITFLPAAFRSALPV